MQNDPNNKYQHYPQQPPYPQQPNQQQIPPYPPQSPYPPQGYPPQPPYPQQQIPPYPPQSPYPPQGYPQQPPYPQQQVPPYPPQSPYPPQGYPQPPYYMQQPPKKQGKGLLTCGIIAAIVVVLLIVATITAANRIGSNSNTTTGSGSTTTTDKIGQAVTVGSTWQVTINSIKTSHGGTFDPPKTGDTYLEVDVTLKNISRQEQSVNSNLMFTLRDSTGQKYTETVTTETIPPDGKVEAGSPVRGTIPYEVPTSVHSYTLTFASSGKQVTWNITD